MGAVSTVVVPHKLATFKQGPALGTETVSYVDKATLLLWDSVAAKAGELQGQGSAKGVHGREGMGQLGFACTTVKCTRALERAALALIWRCVPICYSSPSPSPPPCPRLLPMQL